MWFRSIVSLGRGESECDNYPPVYSACMGLVSVPNTPSTVPANMYRFFQVGLAVPTSVYLCCHNIRLHKVSFVSQLQQTRSSSTDTYQRGSGRSRAWVVERVSVLGTCLQSVHGVSFHHPGPPPRVATNTYQSVDRRGESETIPLPPG